MADDEEILVSVQTFRPAGGNTFMRRRLPPTFDNTDPDDEDINNMRKRPFIDEPSLRQVPPQVQGGYFDDRVDPDEVRIAEEEFRRYVTKLANPIYQHIESIAFWAGKNSTDFVSSEKPEENLILSNARSRPKESDILNPSSARSDTLNDETRKKIAEILTGRGKSFNKEELQVYLRLVGAEADNTVDMDYIRMWEQLGLLAYKGDIWNVNAQAMIKVQKMCALRKKPRDLFSLSRIIKSKNDEVRSTFAQLCAMEISKPRMTSVTRDVTTAHRQTVVSAQQDALDTLALVRWDHTKNDYVIDYKASEATKLMSIDDIYSQLQGGRYPTKHWL